MTALTVDDGIDTLTKARDAVGGDAWILTATHQAANPELTGFADPIHY